MNQDELKQLNEKLETIIEKLENIEFQSMNEMAQKQGSDDVFIYYTLDREPISHYPHVHVCVKSGTKGWTGKNLDNGSPYIDLGAIRLLPNTEYTLDNLTIEHIRDSKIESNRYKKLFIEWLNKPYKNYNITNSQKCIDDYLESNEYCKFKKEYNV